MYKVKDMGWVEYIKFRTYAKLKSTNYSDNEKSAYLAGAIMMSNDALEDYKRVLRLAIKKDPHSALSLIDSIKPDGLDVRLTIAEMGLYLK